MTSLYIYMEGKNTPRSRLAMSPLRAPRWSLECPRQNPSEILRKPYLLRKTLLQNLEDSVAGEQEHETLRGNRAKKIQLVLAIHQSDLGAHRARLLMFGSMEVLTVWVFRR